ncbi:MAG: HTH domain-containing protein [Candidatus Binatia bacterium]
MIKDNLLHLVKFDPEQLRKAIRACEEEAEGLGRQADEIRGMALLYREILHRHGFKENEIEPVSSEERVVAPSSSDRRFRKMKIADAIVMVLREHGGKLHGQKILEALTMGGLRVGSKYPMSTLVTAMHRDARIEKDVRHRNTWKLRHT